VASVDEDAGANAAQPGPQVVVAAAIVRGRRLLAARRVTDGLTAGGWELPGGKVEPGEDERAALVREIGEELGVSVVLHRAVVAPDGGTDWPLPGVGVLRVWTARIVGDVEPVPLTDHDRLRWVTPDEAFDVTWLPADGPVVRQLLSLTRQPAAWPGGSADVPP
jgi:8-oxo-dGTP diphosphatase